MTTYHLHMPGESLSLSSITGGSKRHRGPHRAVAAVQQAALVDPLSGGSPIISLEKPYQCRVNRHPVKVYTSFDELLKERVKIDRLQPKRDALEALREKKAEKCPLMECVDASLLNILAFLGDGSVDAVMFSSTCRRLRFLALSKCNQTEVCVVPNLLSLEEYGGQADTSRESRLASLVKFFNQHTRGQHVQSLSLLDSKYAATLPIHTKLPSASIHQTLSLIAQMPCLTELDVRSVVWGIDAFSKIEYFLSDLYLVAPQLKTLKMGVDLYQSWSPGWWQRHSELCCVVVASRREQPFPQLDGPVATVTLHPDVLLMLQTERPWKLKFWAPLDAAAIRKLLFPSSPFLTLTTLTLNVIGCAPLTQKSDSWEVTESKKGKGAKHPASSVDGDTGSFPRLTSLTLANIEENPMLGVELYAKLSFQAPRLTYFSVCSTVKYPPPERQKNRRRVTMVPSSV